MSNNFGETLKRLIKDFGYTQAGVAAAANLENSKLSRIINLGDRPRSDEDIIRICNVFEKHPKSGAKTPEAQASLIAARCRDYLIGPGAEYVRIMIESAKEPGVYFNPSDTDRALQRLRSALHKRPEWQPLIIHLADLVSAEPKASDGRTTDQPTTIS
jgi:transcriptional regulator with XRE-family HTH domain